MNDAYVFVVLVIEVVFTPAYLLLLIVSSFIGHGEVRVRATVFTKLIGELFELVLEKEFFARLTEAGDVTYYAVQTAYFLGKTFFWKFWALFFVVASPVIFFVSTFAGLMATALPDRGYDFSFWQLIRLPWYVFRALNCTPDTIVIIAIAKFATRSVQGKDKEQERRIAMIIFVFIGLVKALLAFAYYFGI